MARIKLNLKRLSVTDKIAKGRQIVTAMTNNASFPNPTPPLTEVTAALDDLEKAFGLVQSARSEVTTRVVLQENAEVKVDQALTQVAAYVESVGGRNNTLITSAGMETKASPSAPSVPSAPQGVSATAGEHDGEIILSWKPVSNARSYTIEFSLDPATVTSWTHLGIATSASKVIGNLKSGTRYWFRVAAVGAVGQSGWSEHGSKAASAQESIRIRSAFIAVDSQPKQGTLAALPLWPIKEKHVPGPTSNLITVLVFDFGSIAKLVTVFVNPFRFLVREL